jgi:hypothetical protein
MPAPGKKNDDLLREVIERAETDRDFRARLLVDSASAIRHAFGVILPHNYRIKFIEQPADLDALIVLPPFKEAGELGDDDLDMVAGGAETETCGTW